MQQISPIRPSPRRLLVALQLIATITVTVTSQATYLHHHHQQQQQQQQLQQDTNNQQQQQQQLQQAPSIVPFSFNQNVQENQRAMVMCTTSSGETPIQFSWLKDGQLLAPQVAQIRRIAIKHDQDASTLKISSVRLDHSGNYTCVTKNRLGQQAHSAQLLVHGEPRWLKEPQHEPIVTTKGQLVVVDCQTTGWPKPQQSWQIKTHQQNEFEPLTLGSAGGRISLAPNGSLVIRNADKSDEANYLCKSSNGIGKGLSWSTSLRVTVPAHFETPKQQTIVVRKQTQVQLRCDAFGDQPITIDWFKNKQPLVGQQQQLQQQQQQQDAATSLPLEARYSIHSNNNPLRNGLISQLLIRQTQRQDNAIFECVTKNSFGRDRSQLELIVQEEPDNIQELQATQINSRSVTLMWSEPYDGRAGISSYMFQYRKIQDAPPPAPLLSSDLIDFMDPELVAAAASSSNNKSPQQQQQQQQQLSPSSFGSNSPMASPLVGDGDWQHASRIMLPIAANSSAPGSVKSITIEKLEPSSKYLLRALASNSIGQSKFSQPMEFTTDEEAPEIGPINIRAAAINSTSLLISWDEIPKSKHLGRIHGYYIGYRVASNNTAAANFVYKPYIINDLVTIQQQQQQQQQTSHQSQQQSTAANGAAEFISINNQQRLETILHDLRRDTVYEITVVAFNSRGSGPSSDFVVCKTIEMEAPKPVKLQIRRESNESIFIEWQRDPSDQNPVDDYVLYQEKNSASQEWLQVRLPGNQTQYKAPGLKCGTRYQFYIVAQNKVGKSQPSEVVGASTSGALPVIPIKTSLIKMANSTCLLINLNSFQDNGCRIKTFTVRYRVEKTTLAGGANNMNGLATGVTGSAQTIGGQPSSSLINSNGLSATHQALVSSGGTAAGGSSMMSGGQSSGGSGSKVGPLSSGGSGGQSNGGGGGGSGSSMILGQNIATNGALIGGVPSEWINIRPKSNLKHQRANEEDRMEYLCDLNPIGEYTIHVAASNDVGRSEVEYSVLMSSDELRHSALKDLLELVGGMPSGGVFLLAGLLLSLVSLILYTTAIKYYQKFVIMQNQMRATRRAKADEKRRRKLANLSALARKKQNQQNKSDLWADEYEEAAASGELEDQDDLEVGDANGGPMMLDDRELDDGDDEDDDGTTSSGTSGASAGSRTAVMQQIVGRRQQRHAIQQQQQQQQLRKGQYLHQHQYQQQQQQQQQQHHHRRQYSHQNGGLGAARGHYLSNISNSAFDTSSIDSSRCNSQKFGGANSGSTCLSSASTDSIRGGGRFQCLNAKQYVKMNEYTMLPQPSSGPNQQQQQPTTTTSDIYGIASVASGAPPALPSNQTSQSPPTTTNSPNNNNNSLYYSTLRRNSNMQTYLPQQQQRQQLINRRHSQNVADIYGYYMAPGQAAAAAAAAVQVQAQALAAQQAAEEARHSIFVPPQQIIYSAPNIRRPPGGNGGAAGGHQPGLFL